jgi:hypothetical protein
MALGYLHLSLERGGVLLANLAHSQ